MYNKIQRAARFFSGRQNQPSADHVANHACTFAGRSSGATVLLRNADSTAAPSVIPRRSAVRIEEFFLFDPTEIDGVVDAMHGKKDLRWLQLRNGANAFALLVLSESVAGEIRVFIIFTHFEEQIVDGVTET